MKILAVLILIQVFSSSCQSGIDIKKRNLAVEKYDLLNYSKLEKPVLMTVEDFFNGNNDNASIAPNLLQKPPVSEYYNVFHSLLKDERVQGIYVNIKDINIYENGKLDDSEWFFADGIYIVGSISRVEVERLTKHLKPDWVDLDKEETIQKLFPSFAETDVISVWWD